MVDFLQVVPQDQIVLSPTPEGGAYTTESRGDELAEAISEPAPAPAEKAPTEDVSSEAGWPLRQIEIAMGVLVFVLVALVFFARRQRRRWSGV